MTLVDLQLIILLTMMFLIFPLVLFLNYNRIKEESKKEHEDFEDE